MNYFPKLIFGGWLLVTSFRLEAQCNYEFQRGKALSYLPRNYFYTHSLKCTPSEGKSIRATYLMFKNKTYCITLSSKDGEAQGMIATLSDDKNNILCTNYEATEQKFYRKVLFKCKKSGLYSINVSFKESKNNCGYLAVGVKY